MSVEHTDLLRMLVNTGTELARHTVIELLDEIEQLRETRATLNRSIETLVNGVCAATGDDPADEDYAGMMLRLAHLGERATSAEAEVARVRGMHRPVDADDSRIASKVCEECSDPDESEYWFYPCPTIRALEGRS